jgi:hypothetical protein
LALAEYRCEFQPVEDDGRGKHSWLGERCIETTGLEVHHLDYARLGAERDEDLEVLCRFHHQVRHAEAATCAICDEPIFPTQDDAIDWVEDMGDSPPEGLCDYHEHVLTKDD